MGELLLVAGAGPEGKVGRESESAKLWCIVRGCKRAFNFLPKLMASEAVKFAKTSPIFMASLLCRKIPLSRLLWIWRQSFFECMEDCVWFGRMKALIIQEEDSDTDKLPKLPTIMIHLCNALSSYFIEDGPAASPMLMPMLIGGVPAHYFCPAPSYSLGPIFMATLDATETPLSSHKFRYTKQGQQTIKENRKKREGKKVWDEAH